MNSSDLASLCLRSSLTTPRHLAGERSLADAADVDVEGVQRAMGGQEQAVTSAAAEGEVGASLGQVDVADRGGVGGEDSDPVQSLATAPAAPQVAVLVDPQAVRGAVATVDERALLAQRTVPHVVGDDPAVRDGPRLDHIQHRFV